MNNREKILNAWIVIEQLSEGSISKKDSTLQSLCTNTANWQQFFAEYMIKA